MISEQFKHERACNLLSFSIFHQIDLPVGGSSYPVMQLEDLFVCERGSEKGSADHPSQDEWITGQ